MVAYGVCLPDLFTELCKEHAIQYMYLSETFGENE
jgi:hypothetical protein